MSEWKNRDQLEVLMDINSCKNVPKRRRTARDQYVADNHATLERMWRASTETQTKKYIMTNDPNIPRIQELVPWPSTYVFTHVDPEDGCRVKTFSGVDFIRERHLKLTGIFCGPAGYGKTPVAKSFASAISMLNEKPYFYMVSNLDVLPRDDLKSGTVNVFDEFNLNNRFGSMGEYTNDEKKIILDVAEGGTIYGKGSNSKSTGSIHWEKSMPRLITSNASCPNDFCRLIPLGIFEMTDNERCSLSNDTKAILKRCAFFFATVPLIPESMRDAHQTEQFTDSTERFDRIFQGSNAIR